MRNKQLGPMTHQNLRLPQHVVEFFKQRSTQYTSAMRDVLVDYAEKRGAKPDA